jgi:hypothetical protein
MKLNKASTIAAFLLFAFVPAFGQMGDKIGPGNYREIGALRLSGVSTVQVVPGDERQFQLLSTVFGRAGMYREVAAPTKWAVTRSEGIAIDDKGKLKVSKGVKHGTKFKVSASVVIKEEWEKEGYEQTIEQDAIVYDPKENPLVGDWTQNSETDCEGHKSEVNGNNGLRSLEFRADGSYSAAVAPFEVYRDYWGTYAYDTAKGTLKMTIDGGNSDLTALRTEGRYEFKDGVLTIAGMQLHPNAPYTVPCKVHFRK